jgi:hypothetical protein
MPAKTPEEICRLFQRYMSEGDVESLLSIYDPEAVFLTESGEVKKREGLREQLASLAVAKPRYMPSRSPVASRMGVGGGSSAILLRSASGPLRERRSRRRSVGVAPTPAGDLALASYPCIAILKCWD